MVSAQVQDRRSKLETFRVVGLALAFLLDTWISRNRDRIWNYVLQNMLPIFLWTLYKHFICDLHMVDQLALASIEEQAAWFYAPQTTWTASRAKECRPAVPLCRLSLLQFRSWWSPDLRWLAAWLEAFSGLLSTKVFYERIEQHRVDLRFGVENINHLGTSCYYFIHGCLKEYCFLFVGENRGYFSKSAIWIIIIDRFCKCHFFVVKQCFFYKCS